MREKKGESLKIKFCCRKILDKSDDTWYNYSIESKRRIYMAKDIYQARADRALRDPIYLLLQSAPKELLTAEEEVYLGRIIQKYIGKKNTSEEKIEFDDARETFMLHNLRLVVKIANKYAGYKIPLEDLVQEGIFGLISAVERFDPERGFRFSTMASYWIQQAIYRFISENRRVIRYPTHVSESLSKINRATEALTADLHREPTDEELSAKLGGKLTVEKIQELRFLTQGITSTNTVVGDDEDTELQEFLWDKDTETPEDYAMTIGSVESIEELLNQLTPQEKKIIVSRYGLDDGEQLTLEEIGIEMGLTRERIRQLERDAINKMRIYSRDNNLDLF